MQNQINNTFYEELGEAWYESDTHPVALLRLENRARNPWILEKIHSLLGEHQKILDLGCGAGFLTNAFAKQGHQVTGVDLSAQSLEVAKKRDSTHSVHYLHLDAFALAFPEKSFDVVCAMDFLEHIERPEKIIQQAARLLRPGGLFFFHTFNRNMLSYFLVIKGPEWCMPNTPHHMHLYSYFIKPSELKQWCEESGLKLIEMQGLRPRIGSIAFWKSVTTRKIHKDFSFMFTSSLKTGYLGVSRTNT